MNQFEILKQAEETVDSIIKELITIRHKLHEIPEIGYREYKTSKLLKEILNKYNVNSYTSYLATDIVGLINPEKENKNVTLRADIDAIAQYELNDFEYKSKIEGMMHACGHDGHAVILLGTTIVLNQLKEFLPGSVRFLFQPAEEGLRGADYLIEKGIFEKNKPDAVLGLHNFPTLEEGIFFGKSGVYTSSVTPFKIKIIGKSIHSSEPEKGIDPLLTGAEIVNELNNIINTPKNILYKTNLKVCKFHSGTAGNVIPSFALLEGTARCYKQEQEERTAPTIKNIVQKICNKYNAEYDAAIAQPMRLINNDYHLLKLAEKAVTELFGKKYWMNINEPFRFSEDFSAFMKECPGLYLCIGAGMHRTALHTQKFDFNDNIIKKAILFWIKITLDILYSE